MYVFTEKSRYLNKYFDQLSGSRIELSLAYFRARWRSVN